MPQLLLSSLLLLIFALLPQLDIAISSLVYRPDVGFIYSQQPWVLMVFHSVTILTPLLIAGLLTMLLASSLRPQWRDLRPRAAFLLLALVLGPGLLAHTLFKDHWGRPRPVETQPFGGPQTFMPAAVPGGACDRNCSFVSGHAVMGFYLLSFGYAWPGRRRRWQLIGLLAGVTIGAARVLQGKHFASDVLGAYWVVVLSCVLIQGLWRRWNLPLLSE